MKNLIILNLVVSLAWPVLAKKSQTENIDSLVLKSMQFISNSQFSSKQDIYSPGEWPTNMRTYLLPSVLGVGKPFSLPIQEPTAFTTASVVNLLSEIYYLDPQLSQIPEMIRLATTSFSLYQDQDLYSYYQWKDYRGHKVRGPLAKGYAPNFLSGLTNIPNDADTTSSTYLALANANKILSESVGQPLKPQSDFKLPEGALQAFSEFRDVKRKPHYYDRFLQVKSSGAYLTWFYDEENPEMPGLLSKPDKGSRIPFGKNDVDCVVNANVLRLLTVTQNTKAPGYESSCQLLNENILNDQQAQCGIYYPNAYGVYFSISNAYKAGAQCLEASRDHALAFLMQTQRIDGSWENNFGAGRLDVIQSTALALNSLMNYTDKGHPMYLNSVRLAAKYLIKHAQIKNDNEVYWKGEVFFSAVAQARNTVLWRSDSYTTALVALALVKAKAYLKEDL